MFSHPMNVRVGQGFYGFAAAPRWKERVLAGACCTLLLLAPAVLGESTRRQAAGNDAGASLSRAALSAAPAPESSATQRPDAQGQAAVEESIRNYRPGSAPPSAGPAPFSATQRDEAVGPSVNVAVIPTDSAFGHEFLSDQIVDFALNAPGAISFNGAVNVGSFNGQDFGNNGDFSFLYALQSVPDQLVTIDTTTGALAVIGPSVPFGGESWSGLAMDPTSSIMYACSTNIAAASLYTIDLTTGTPTRIGAIAGAPCTIDIAIDSTGQMYGLDICTDQLFSINKATGVGAALGGVGAIGFNANFSQGMDFDESDGTLYLAAYNGGTNRGELRTGNTVTGGTVLIGLIGPDQRELGDVAIATGGFCPDTSYYSDIPIPPNGPWTFGTSDQDSSFLRYKFLSAPAPICAAGWWGIQFDFGVFDDCVEVPADIEIEVYEDAAGTLGPLVCSYTVSIAPIDTGIDYNAGILVRMLEFRTSLDTCCDLGGADGWISMQGFGGNPNCQHLWAASGAGSSLVDSGGGPVAEVYDLSLCLFDKPDPPTVGDDTCFVGITDTGLSCSTNADCTNFVSDPNLAIPDNNPAGIADIINVPISETITDLNVDLIIPHTWVGDLIVTLQHGGGGPVTLIDRAGLPASAFGCESNDYDIVLDDEGIVAPTIEDLCGPAAGSTPTSPPNYVPNSALSAFDGQLSSGAWTLRVSDNVGADVGRLVHWSLHFTLSSNPVCDLRSRYLGMTATNAATAGPATPTSIKLEIVSMMECNGGVNVARGCLTSGDPHCPGALCVPSPKIGDIWWLEGFNPGVDSVTPGNLPNPSGPVLTGGQFECTGAAPLNAQVWPGTVIYLSGAPIVPNATYKLYMCDAAGNVCSAPGTFSTGIWGNVVPAHTVANFLDVSEVVNKFRFFVLPIMPRADLTGTGNPGFPNIPNQVANFADVSAAVDAFRGFPYPFTVPACP